MWPFSQRVSEPTYTADQVTDMVTNAAHESAAYAIEEANASAEAQLALEDKGWTTMGEQGGTVISEAQRRKIVTMSRAFSVIEGIPKQIVSLWRNYTVGGELEVKAKDEDAQKVLTEFQDKPENRAAFSFHGQRATEFRKLLDGELYTALFAKDNSDIPTVRWLDSLQMQTATDPDDKWTARWHVRSFTDSVTGKQKTYYYRDWSNPEGEPGVLSGKVVPPGGDSDEGIQPDVVVFQTKLSGSPDPHGYPLLTTVIRWSEAHRRFMRARVAIQQALAVFAQKLTGKGSQTQISALATSLQSGLVNGDTENNPVGAPGGIFGENQNASLTNMKQETGAAAAQIDGAMLIQMQGIGPGIFSHYLGAGEAFRLATATAMEGPMLRQFEAERQEIHDYYGGIFQWVLARAGIAPDKRAVDIDSMEVNATMLDSDVNAMDKLTTIFPELKQSPEILKRALGLLRQNGIDDIMATIEKEIDGQAEREETAESGKLSRLHSIAKVLREFREAKSKGE